MFSAFLHLNVFHNWYVNKTADFFQLYSNVINFAVIVLFTSRFTLYIEITWESVSPAVKFAFQCDRTLKV